MDAQSRAGRRGGAGRGRPVPGRRGAGDRRLPAAPELLDENRFLAARDGMRAQIVDVASLERRSMANCVANLLVACAPVACQLGCEDELAAAAELAVSPGDARQREWAQSDGIGALPAWLAEEFAPVRDAAVA